MSMTFGQQLTHLVNANLQAGRTPQEIVLVLEIAKIELVNSLLATHAAARSAGEAPALIVPPGHNHNGEKL